MPFIVRTQSEPRFKQSTGYYGGGLIAQYPDPLVVNPTFSGKTFISTVTRVNELTFRRDWRKLIRDGENATTNVETSSVSWKCNSELVGFTVTVSPTTWGWSYMSGAFMLYPDESSLLGDLPNVVAQANMKFLLKCSEAVTRFSGSTSIGELRETIGLIRTPGRLLTERLERHVRDTKRRLDRIPGVRYVNGRPTGEPAVFRKWRREASNAWLQFKFGVSPLLADIDNGCEALADYFQRPPRDHVTCNVKDFQSKVVERGQTGYGSLAWKERTISSIKLRVDMKGMISLSAANDLGPLVTRHFGLSWNEVVLAGWELVPYSFLVDYFFNIGEILEASMFPQSLIKWAYRSIRTKRTDKNFVLHDTLRDADNGTNFVHAWQVPSENSLSKITSYVRRERADDFYFPPFQFRVPGTASTRWCNIAALLAQR
jgi:hypothetical protein